MKYALIFNDNKNEFVIEVYEKRKSKKELDSIISYYKRNGFDGQFKLKKYKCN